MNDNSLQSLLTNLTKDRLLQMARAHDLPVSNERKPELVSLLAQRLRDPLAVHQLIAHLPAPAQMAFTHVRDAGGRVMSRSLLTDLERDGLAHAGAVTRSARYTTRNHTPSALATFEEALEPLFERGLLLSVTSRWLTPTGDNLVRYNVELMIAHEVLAAAREAERPLAQVSKARLEISEASAQDFQRDVYLYWNYLREQDVKLTAAGLIPKRHLVRLNDALNVRLDLRGVRDETQAARIHFIRVMMEATGLIRRNQRRVEALPGAVEFFGYTLARRTDRFFQAWRRSAEWNELLHLPVRPRQHEQRAAKAIQLVVRARQYVLSLIEEYATQGWLSIDDLVNKVRVSHYDILFKRTREEYGAVNPYYYFHNPLGWGFPVGEEREGWEKVEKEFIRTLVRQPLQWLGLVSLGEEQAVLSAFRLTGLGEYVFGLSAHAPGTPGSGVP